MTIRLTLPLLREIFPRGHAAALQSLVDKQHILEREGINHTRTRLATLFAHLNHESNGLSVFEENLNYSAQRLTQVWPSRFPTLEAARPYAFNPQALANNVYGGRMGNKLPGDGWKFRGSGGPQCTGHDCFLAVEKYSGIPFSTKPELARDPSYTVELCAGFWAWKQMNRFADTGDIKASTLPWNGGYNGLAERATDFRRFMVILAKAEGAPPTAQPPKAALDAASANEARLRNAGAAAAAAGAATKTSTSVQSPEKIVTAESAVDWFAIAAVALGIAIVMGAIVAMVRKKKQVIDNWK